MRVIRVKNTGCVSDLRALPASRDHYDAIVSGNADIIDEDTGHIVVRMRAGVVSNKSCALVADAFGTLDEDAPPSLSRRDAAGVVSAERFADFRDDVVGVVPVTATTGRLVLKSGKTLKQAMSNPVRSFLGGYGYQRFKGEAYAHLVTSRFPKRWESAWPFFREVDEFYAGAMPEHWSAQRERALSHREWTIRDTAFSTVTINLNYGSAYHYDSGDFKGGYSTLSVVEMGEYAGGLLVLPQYRVALDVRHGGVALKQSHLVMHGNTQVTGPGKRLSLVTYMKDAISRASNIKRMGIS